MKAYLAGSLFDIRHVMGNAYLAAAIEKCSGGRYVVVAPQNLELPSMDPRSIRDEDYRAILGCDVGIFLFDGTELDSGTVAEFMAAKFADIPCVQLRTDFRRGGDRNERPWNLMCDFFPRTEALVLDGMALYTRRTAKGANPKEAAEGAIAEIAEEVVRKLDIVAAQPPGFGEKEVNARRVADALGLSKEKGGLG